jgi:hypothetical protein
MKNYVIKNMDSGEYYNKDLFPVQWVSLEEANKFISLLAVKITRDHLIATFCINCEVKTIELKEVD